MLDSLILAAALMTSQGGYNMPSAPPPTPRTERPATATPQAPAAPPKPSVAAVAGKTLKDLPNVTIRYFDVTGKNLKAINKSIERSQKPDSAGRVAASPTTYAVDAAFNKLAGSGQCRITSAKATFSATVVLPRLVPDRAHTPELKAAWAAYLAGVENSQAANLWFVYDRIGEVEKAIVASTCDGAQAAGAAAIQRLKAQAADFQRSIAPAAAAAK